MKSMVRAAAVGGCTLQAGLPCPICLLSKTKCYPPTRFTVLVPALREPTLHLFSCAFSFSLTGNNRTFDLRCCSRGIFLPAHPFRHGPFHLLLFWQQVRHHPFLKNPPGVSTIGFKKRFGGKGLLLNAWRSTWVLGGWREVREQQQTTQPIPLMTGTSINLGCFSCLGQLDLSKMVQKVVFFF